MDNQKGIAPIVIVLIIGIVSLGGFVVYQSQTTNKNTEPPTPEVVSAPTNSPTPIPSPTTKPLFSAKSSPSPSSKTPTPSPSPKPTVQIKKLSCNLYVVNNSNTNWPPFAASFGLDWEIDPSKAGTIGLDKLQYDLDGDSNWDTDWITIPPAGTSIPNYIYTKAGTYSPKAQIMAKDGETSDPCSTTIKILSPEVSCKVRSDKTDGETPLTVAFSYEAIFNGVRGDDYVTNVQWDFDGDGNWDTPMNYESQQTSHTYQVPGNYTIKMHLQSKNGLNSPICSTTISVH